MQTWMKKSNWKKNNLAIGQKLERVSKFGVDVHMKRKSTHNALQLITPQSINSNNGAEVAESFWAKVIAIQLKASINNL